MKSWDGGIGVDIGVNKGVMAKDFLHRAILKRDWRMMVNELDSPDERLECLAEKSFELVNPIKGEGVVGVVGVGIGVGVVVDNLGGGCCVVGIVIL